MMSVIDFDESAVDESLFEEERQSLPPIVWHGRHGHPAAGWFTLDRDAVDGEPAPFWEAGEVQFGMSPNSPAVPVWKTQRLRCCVIGQRKRQIIKDDYGQLHYYPAWTKREERIDGKFKLHTQVAVVLPGSDELVQLTLKGYAKTLMWSNSPGRYHNPDFGNGVWPTLVEYVNKWRAQTGKRKLPYLCTAWIDLVPAMAAGGKELGYVDVGNSVFMAAFQADMRTAESDDVLPETRYVGQETFERLAALRRDVVVPWEKEWRTAERMASSPAGDDAGADVEETPEDEIPF